MPPKPYILEQATYRQLRDAPPNLAVLPWGASEAHNYHLPHGTDNIQARALAQSAAAIAHERGARLVVLPAIPFGNNEQQLDQVATISIRTRTALALLEDVARSLAAQQIDRLIIVNSHGGNEFKPLVRDVQRQSGVFFVVVNFWQMRPELLDDIFDEPGDHAGDLETSLLLHLCPEWVRMQDAGAGESRPMQLNRTRQPGAWTPRPWSAVHPDTGSGDPSRASAEKGRRYFEAVCAALAELFVEVSGATKGQLPYV